MYLGHVSSPLSSILKTMDTFRNSLFSSLTFVDSAIFENELFNELKSLSNCLSLKLAQEVLLSPIAQMQLALLSIRVSKAR